MPMTVQSLSTGQAPGQHNLYAVEQREGGGLDYQEAINPRSNIKVFTGERVVGKSARRNN